MAVDEDDFYLRLRRRVHAWASRQGRHHRHLEFILLAPDFFHLLAKLSTDRDVPAGERVKLAAAVLYFVTPFDLMPEAVFGPAGYLDDVALTAHVLHGLINAGHGAIAQRHWAGRKDLLEAVQMVLRDANERLGAGLWSRLRNVTGRS